MKKKWWGEEEEEVKCKIIVVKMQNEHNKFSKIVDWANNKKIKLTFY